MHSIFCLKNKIMPNPKVSIIMPVYNAMPYLEMAIKSIFGQTYENWELIIVDDCSKDGSWEYLKQIKEPRIRLYRNKNNMGCPYTCNKAYELCRGRYVARMDSDDISFPERIEKQVLFLENNPEIDVIGCGLVKIDNSFKIIQLNLPKTNHKDIIDFNRSLLFGPNIGITDGTLVGKIEWFQKWNYDHKVPYGFDLYFRACYQSKYGTNKSNEHLF